MIDTHEQKLHLLEVTGTYRVVQLYLTPLDLRFSDGKQGDTTGF